MKKIAGLLAMAAVLVSAVAFANPPKKTAKVQDVWTCPMTGEKVTDKKNPTAVAGKYRVHFCCANCPAGFAKLSDKEKQAKITAALKKKSASTKTDANTVATKTEAEKVTDVWTCPISGGAVKDHEAAKAGAVLVGNYRVHFCCDGCPSQFAKLSDEEKKEKAVAAAKKETGS